MAIQLKERKEETTDSVKVTNRKGKSRKNQPQSEQPLRSHLTLKVIKDGWEQFKKTAEAS